MEIGKDNDALLEKHKELAPFFAGELRCLHANTGMVIADMVRKLTR